MKMWKGFQVICGVCNHVNRPHRSPRKGIALAFLRKLGECKGCGRELNLVPDSNRRPVTFKVKMALFQAGFIDIYGNPVNPPPPGDPLDVVDWRNDPELQPS